MGPLKLVPARGACLAMPADLKFIIIQRMHHISSTLKNTGDRTHTQPCKRETMLGFCIFLKVLLCSLAPYSCDGNEMEHIRGMLALVTGFFSKRLCFFFELGVLPSKRGRCFQSFHAIKHLLEFVLL